MGSVFCYVTSIIMHGTLQQQYLVVTSLEYLDLTHNSTVVTFF